MTSCSAGCCGDCGSCGGCAKALVLTQPELDMLTALGQFSFLPVARKVDNMTPVYLEDTRYTPEEYSQILQLLETKQLIDIDYGKPLVGADMTAYKDYPVHGSIALTARGQTVLDTIDMQGIAQ